MLLQKSLIEYTRLNFKACQPIKNLHNTKNAQTNFYQNFMPKSNLYLEPLKSSKLFQRQPNFIDSSINHGNILSRNYSSKSTYYIQNPFKWSNNHMKLFQVKRTWDPKLDKDEFIEGSKFAVLSVLQEIKEIVYFITTYNRYFMLNNNGKDLYFDFMVRYP